MTWLEPLVSGMVLALYGTAVGVLAGVAVGLVGHWLSPGSRHFLTVATLEAGRYELRTDTAEGADEARHRLDGAQEPEFPAAPR